VDKPILRTVDPENALGEREKYLITDFPIGAETKGDLPALVMFMPFELLPTLYGAERNINIAQVEVTMHREFMQRRVNTTGSSFLDLKAEESFWSRCIGRKCTLGDPLKGKES
jgi:hypothetical protein